MLKYNEYAYQELKKKYENLMLNDIADKIFANRLAMEIQEIENIDERFIYPDDYKKVNPFLNDIEQKLLSGEQTGLLFTGGTRRGKTYLMDIIRKNFVRLYIKPFRRFMPYVNTTNKLYKSYLKDKEYAPDYPLAKYMFIDDLGNEVPQTDKTKAFIGDFILHLHDNFKASKIHFLVITTNLDWKKMCEYYGERIAYRLTDIVPVYEFKNDKFKNYKVYGKEFKK